MNFIRLYEVKLPLRGTKKSAGIDLSIPADTEEFCKRFIEANPSKLPVVEGTIYISPHERVKIPSGLKFKIPEGTALIAANRSGVATKKGLIYGAQVVDEDYQGELFISLINTSDNVVEINCGEKIIQLLHVPLLQEELVELKDETELFQGIKTERGSGGFGSTGIK